jgi:hypothetical protein
MSDRTPTPAQIAVALQALRDDAARWSRGATHLQTATAHVDSATLPTDAFSVLGGDMASAYEALRGRVGALLDEATANYVAVASALHESADTYESEERANVHRLRHVY